MFGKYEESCNFAICFSEANTQTNKQTIKQTKNKQNNKHNTKQNTTKQQTQNKTNEHKTNQNKTKQTNKQTNNNKNKDIIEHPPHSIGRCLSAYSIYGQKWWNIKTITMLAHQKCLFSWDAIAFQCWGKSVGNRQGNKDVGANLYYSAENKHDNS